MDNKSNIKRRNSNHGIGSGVAVSKPIKRSSLAEGVDMLIYGPETNLREVERCLQIVTTVKFGKRRDFFAEMKYPKVEPPKVNVQQYKNPDNIGYKIVTDKLLSKFAEQESDFEENKPRFYAMILGVLSADGESAVKLHADFKKAVDDPLELWKIVKSTHLVNSSNNDSEVQRQDQLSNNLPNDPSGAVRATGSL